MEHLFASLNSVQQQYLDQGLSDPTAKAFQDAVLAYHTANPRTFPWRDNPEPYQVMVSEIMLQQTQAERVVEKFQAFLRAYPTVQALAESTTAELLTLWQGLGYNRRALNLRRAAVEVVQKHGGTVPYDLGSLLALPGIGPYTAGAIGAFAFDLPGEVIDTNIRRVYIHVFFPKQVKVSDRELAPYLTATQYCASPRVWYSALMDVGHLLPKAGGNANVRSQHYARQPPLSGSNREVRGIIIRLLTSTAQAHVQRLPDLLQIPSSRIEPALAQLTQEGFVVQEEDMVRLA